jgi:hypothetical protein
LTHLEFFELQKREFLAGLDHPGGACGAHDQRREGPFAQMLRFEADAFEDRIPGGVEYGFGAEDAVPIVIGGARIRGGIDRFDLSKQEGESAYLYDYKTGGSPSSEMIKRGAPRGDRGIREGVPFARAGSLSTPAPRWDVPTLIPAFWSSPATCDFSPIQIQSLFFFDFRHPIARRSPNPLITSFSLISSCSLVTSYLSLVTSLSL